MLRKVLVVAGCGLVIGALATGRAMADFKIHAPVVVKGELEIEGYADRSFDRRADKDNSQSHNYEIGYGVTDWWQPELELELHKDAGGDLRYDALTFENTFQPFQQGEYVVDLGFFAEFARAHRHDDPNEITFGPLLQKQVGSTLHTANLLLSKEYGSNASTGTTLQYAWQSKWLWQAELEPGFEIFGEPGKFRHFNRFSDQDLRAGPILAGAFVLPRGNGKIKYEIGYFFGLTDATERGVAKLQLEYEMFF